MTIFENPLYEFYISHLERKKLSKGSMSLLKISKENFDEYVNRYNDDDDFREKENSYQVVALRKIKIKKVVEEDDFDSFIKNL